VELIFAQDSMLWGIFKHQSPIHIAAACGHSAILTMLLEKILRSVDNDSSATNAEKVEALERARRLTGTLFLHLTLFLFF